MEPQWLIGPVWQDENGDWSAEIQTVGGHDVVATAYGQTRDYAIANATLIAAEPDLYEALETCLAMGERQLKQSMNLAGKSPYDIGLAALRKARGES